MLDLGLKISSNDRMPEQISLKSARRLTVQMSYRRKDIGICGYSGN